jgi:asparagine synthetase B (glutamine-hydrolysing)
MQLRQRIFKSSSGLLADSVRVCEKLRITADFVCYRLEQCAAHALYYGLEYRNPLSDRDLMEYALSLPAEIKVRAGNNRYPYRMALEGMVPENVRWRNDKTGATIPSVMPRIVADSNRLDAALNDPAIAWPAFVDMEKMRNIKQRLDNKRLNDGLYPHSFYSVLMMIDGF